MTTDDGTPTGNRATGGGPPRNSRFKPGQSGNPRGRPKGSTNLSTKIRQELRKVVTVTRNGKPAKVTKCDVVAAVAVDEAMQRNLQAAIFVHKLDQEAAIGETAASVSTSGFVIPSKDNLKFIAKRLNRVTEEY
jgi:hypothetical protein